MMYLKASSASMAEAILEGVGTVFVADSVQVLMMQKGSLWDAKSKVRRI